MDTCDAPEPAWRIAPSGHVRPLEQKRTRVEREGEPNGVEQLRYFCRPGYSARCSRAIGRAPVLDELRVSLAIKCNAPGAQLAARVVLPRSVDPGTGRPTTALLRGERYETPDEWRTLSLAETPRLTAAAARLLRARPGSPPIDERGAYVDRVVLLLPGAPKGVEVLIDDLRVDGVLQTETDPVAANRDGPELPELRSGPLPSEQRVAVNASGFTIGGRAFFPRVWSHREGGLSAAREAGFNTVAFKQPPTTEQLAEAAKQKLRVLCPPPDDEAPNTKGLDAAVWRPVLAWIVGGRGDSTDAARAFAERIRRTDLALQRPLIADADGDWAAWSRIADVLVVTRTGPKSAAADRLWAERVQDIRRLARPGTPLVQRVRATPSAEASRQLAVLADLGADDGLAADREIGAAVWSAVADGVAGVWITADRRLSAADASTVRLRRGLTLLNLQLDLVDPWLAGGERGPRLVDTRGEPRAVLLKRGRVRLVAPTAQARSSSPAGPLVVPGVSASSQAYRLTPAGVTPAPAERVAGGVRIDGAAVGPWSMALLTDDRPAVSAIAGRASKTAETAVDLQLRLAREELSRFSHQLTQDRRVAPSPVRREAERRISVANAAAAAGDRMQAFASASAARAVLARPANPTRDADPLTRSPLDLIDGDPRVAEQLGVLLAGAPRGANLLAGGDFENLDETRAAGWTNTTLPLDGVGAAVELSAENPAHGARGLRMATTLDNGAAMPLAAGDCPVWITTPPTTLAAGQVVEVTGWVRLKPAGGEQRARLIISDTLGGPRLGRVVEDAAKWRRFRLLRRAPQETELRVTFGLSGVGEAFVDAVMIRPVQIGATPTPPATLRPTEPVAVRPGGDQAK